MQTIIPFINPLHFTKADPAVATSYMTKHMDDWTHAAQIRPWQSRNYYWQPWMTTDVIWLHLWTDGGIPVFRIIDRDGKVFYSASMQQKQQSTVSVGTYAYETQYSLAATPEGYYHAEIVIAGTTFVSDEFEVSEKIENSVLIEYKGLDLYEDVLWATGFSPRIRVRADISGLKPESVRTVYTDMAANLVPLDAKNYRLWKLFINSTGVPDWMADKLNLILGCPTLLIDGRSYVVAEDAKMEVVQLEKYPLSGWSIDLRERYARASRIYQDDTPVNGELLAMVVTNTKGFSENSDEGNDIIITNIQ